MIVLKKVLITFMLCKSACPTVGGFINLILYKNNLNSVAPEFTDGVKSFCVGVGNSFSLRLNLEAQPDAGSNFSWTKDGVAYQGNVSANSLNISNVALGDAGVYNVIASNSLGSDSHSFTLTITREYAAANYKFLIIFMLYSITISIPSSKMICIVMCIYMSVYGHFS